ncbi:MAG TPA: hypothetical protein VKI64_11940, partial [Acidimicrobiales bacterium]|nr:hypothetical protein [Acidimicrobiales bacterium]
VLSYDPEANAIVPRKVVNWFDNGPTDEFLHFSIARPETRGCSGFACTPNHLVRTPGGWREAQELAVGDRVLQAVPHYLSDFQRQVILGSLMGDGALSPSSTGHGARFRWGHGKKQVDYADWKAALFANVGISRSTNAKGAVFHDMTPLTELGELRRVVYVDGKKVFDHGYLKELRPLSLAIWYQDDGSFTERALGLQARTRDGSGRSEICVEAMEPASRERLVQYLADTWDIHPVLSHRGARRIAVLTFPKEETAKLHALIAPFVHPSMEYKLLPRYRGQFVVEPSFVPMQYKLLPMPILEIGRRAPISNMHRFDIEVEGSHNYFVDGVMVHNSPETTPGGRALKFYSSVRLDIRRLESIKDGVEVVGNRVRVKVVKNKCLAAGTMVLDPTTGLTHLIEDVVDRGEGTSVIAADQLGKLHVRPIVNRFDQGEAEVIGLTLSDWTTLWATPDHKVFTDSGWKEAGELAVGDCVARPRWVPGLADSGHKGDGRVIANAPGAPAGQGGAAGRTVTAELSRPALGAVDVDDVWYDRIVAVQPLEWRPVYDIEVDDLHTFVADDVVVSNCSAPFRQAEFEIMYGKGISREASLIDVGVEIGIVKKSGAWYTYEGEQLGQGKENSKQFLVEHPEVMIEINERIRQQVGVGTRVDVPLDEGAGDDAPITLGD